MNIKDIIKNLKKDLEKVNFRDSMLLLQDLKNINFHERMLGDLKNLEFHSSMLQDLKNINFHERMLRDQFTKTEKRYIEGFNLIISAMYLGLNVADDREFYKILLEILGPYSFNSNTYHMLLKHRCDLLNKDFITGTVRIHYSIFQYVNYAYDFITRMEIPDSLLELKEYLAILGYYEAIKDPQKLKTFYYMGCVMLIYKFLVANDLLNKNDKEYFEILEDILGRLEVSNEVIFHNLIIYKCTYLFSFRLSQDEEYIYVNKFYRRVGLMHPKILKLKEDLININFIKTMLDWELYQDSQGLLDSYEDNKDLLDSYEDKQDAFLVLYDQDLLHHYKEDNQHLMDLYEEDNQDLEDFYEEGFQLIDTTFAKLHIYMIKEDKEFFSTLVTIVGSIRNRNTYIRLLDKRNYELKRPCTSVPEYKLYVADLLHGIEYNRRDVIIILKKDLFDLGFTDIMLQLYKMRYKENEELYNKYMIGYNLICTTFSSFGLYTLSDQEFDIILLEILGPYNHVTDETYRQLILHRHQQLKKYRESYEYYSSERAKSYAKYNSMQV
jgi:hypothetical protein